MKDLYVKNEFKMQRNVYKKSVSKWSKNIKKEKKKK